MQKNKVFLAAVFILAAIILFETIWIILLLRRPAEAIARAAIVLDDWGYNDYNLKEALSMGRPLTLAVLPDLEYSKYIAEEAGRNKLEVILHLPLEAHDRRKRPEKQTIRASMTRSEIINTFRKKLSAVPGARGVSNHMGSKATEDEWLMNMLFGELRKKKLFFLDSLVTERSVCGRMAGRNHIRFAERDIFLDNENDLAYIKGQLRQLISVAKTKRRAIGIGHDRRLTLAAIKQMLPAFDREGIGLVYLSELVK